MLLSAMFGFTCITVLQIYNTKLSEEIFKFAETQSGVPLKTYHQESIILIQEFIKNTTLWIEHVKLDLERVFK